MQIGIFLRLTVYPLKGYTEIMGRVKTVRAREELIEWLNNAVKSSGLSPSAFARLAGVGQSSVSQILSGKRGVSHEMVRKLAAAASLNETDETKRQRLINEGIRAAFPTDDEWHMVMHDGRVMYIKAKKLIDAYERATPREREVFDALARAITETEAEVKEGGEASSN